MRAGNLVNIQEQNENITFDQIYQFAKEKNEHGLAELLKQGVCVDLYLFPHTPVLLLASVGDVESVRFLINKFNASVHHAARGAALAGDRGLMSELINRGANLDFAVEGAALGRRWDIMNELLDRGASLHWAVRGAAQAGDKDMVKELIGRIDVAFHSAGRHFVHRVSGTAGLDFAAEGAARGGRWEMVLDLLAQGANFYYAGEGAALAGQRDIMNELLDVSIRENNAIRTQAALIFAMRGAGLGGHGEIIEKLRASGEKSVGFAVQTAALGGHWGLVKHLLIEDTIGLNYAVYGAAQGDHQDLMEELLAKGACLSWAAQGAAENGNLRLVNQLAARGASPGWVTAGATKGGHLSEQRRLQFISSIDNAELRKKLVDCVCEMDRSVDAELLLKQAETHHLLMKEYNLNYSEAQTLIQSGVEKCLLKRESQRDDSTEISAGVLRINLSLLKLAIQAELSGDNRKIPFMFFKIPKPTGTENTVPVSSVSPASPGMSGSK